MFAEIGSQGGGLLDDNSRIFNAPAEALTLESLTLTGGRTTETNALGSAVLGGTVTLCDSALSGNSTSGDRGYGGALFATDATVETTTLSGNSKAGERAYGGGLAAYDATLTDSLVLGNKAQQSGDELIGTVSFTGANLVGANALAFDASVSGAVAHADPTQVFAQSFDNNGVQAGVLADNGGQTETILILESGPAQNAGTNPTPPATDQRGELRNDTATDLGAVELQPSPFGEIGSLAITSSQQTVTLQKS